MYNTYIFDLDGTLLSTLADLAASCNYALTSNGMPERTIDEVRRFVGNGVKKLMERAVPGGLDNPAFDKTYADFRQHYMQHNLDTTCPYDGVMELLHSGAPNFLASTTLRPLGPRVTLTVSARVLTPVSSALRASSPDLISLDIIHYLL